MIPVILSPIWKPPLWSCYYKSKSNNWTARQLYWMKLSATIKNQRFYWLNQDLQYPITPKDHRAHPLVQDPLKSPHLQPSITFLIKATITHICILFINAVMMTNSHKDGLGRLWWLAHSMLEIPEVFWL